jgi:hypothetical protein
VQGPLTRTRGLGQGRSVRDLDATCFRHRHRSVLPFLYHISARRPRKPIPAWSVLFNCSSPGLSTQRTAPLPCPFTWAT